MKLIDMALEDAREELRLADEELEKVEEELEKVEEEYKIAKFNMVDIERKLFKAKSKAMFANNKHSRALELKDKIQTLKSE